VFDPSSRYVADPRVRGPVNGVRYISLRVKSAHARAGLREGVGYADLTDEGPTDTEYASCGCGPCREIPFVDYSVSMAGGEAPARSGPRAFFDGSKHRRIRRSRRTRKAARRAWRLPLDPEDDSRGTTSARVAPQR